MTIRAPSEAQRHQEAERERLEALAPSDTSLARPVSIGLDRVSAADAEGAREIALELFASYVRRNHPLVWSGGLVELMNEFRLAQPASRIAVSRLVDKGYISRVRQGRYIHYEITDDGERLLADGDRSILSLGTSAAPVDLWTLLMHSLPPESRRECRELGQQLRAHGFGRLQDRIWVAPYDQRPLVDDVVLDLGLREHVVVLVGRPSRDVGVAAFLDKAWDLKHLLNQYASFAATYLPYARTAERARLTDREAFVIRTNLVHTFRSLADDDPGLPDGMLPDPGARRIAIEIFHAAFDGLAEAAQRYFDRVCYSWFQRGGDAETVTRGSSD